MVPRSLQQNSVVERKNRTVLNIARCVLKVKNMLREFWIKAISCVVYLLNKDQTLEEAWSGTKPSVNHLQIFGSVAYVHVPNQGRSKLDDRN